MIILTKLVIDVNEPEYTTVLWYQPKEKNVYVHLNGEWVPLTDCDSQIHHILNELADIKIDIQDIKISIQHFEDCCTDVKQDIINITDILTNINNQIIDIDITNINTTFEMLNTHIENIYEKISKNEYNIENVNNIVIELQTKIEDFEECCEFVQTRITNIEKDIITISQKLNDSHAKYNVEINSVAIGNKTVANGTNQVVFGGYNEPNATDIEIVGGGNGNDTMTVIHTSTDLIFNCMYIGNLTNDSETILCEKLLPLVRNKYKNKYVYIGTTDNQKGNVTTLVNEIKNQCEGDLYFIYYDNYNWVNDDQYCLLAVKQNASIEPGQSLYIVGWSFAEQGTVDNVTTQPYGYNLRTLDANGNETLAGGLTTQYIQWYNSQYGTKTITADEAVLIPTIKYSSTESIVLQNITDASAKITAAFPTLQSFQDIINKQSKSVILLTVDSEQNTWVWYPHSGWNWNSSLHTFKSTLVNPLTNDLCELYFIYNALSNTINQYYGKVENLYTGTITYYKYLPPSIQ